MTYEKFTNGLQKHLETLNDLLKKFNSSYLTYNELDIDKIEPTLTTTIDTDYYDELREDILEDGVIPILVVKGDNIIIDGNHRFEILKQLGVEKIPVLEWNGKYLSDDEQIIAFDLLYKEYTPTVKVKMKYVKSYESIFESLYSNEFRNAINKIDSPISKMILDFNKPLDISQINITDSENMVSYLRNGKKEAMKIGSFVTRILTELDEKVHPTVFEKFINEYKGVISSIKAFQNIDIVYGENIRKFYFEPTYAEGGGSLNQSCMRHDYCQPYLDMFVDNPDKINLLILRNSTNKLKIDGRALLWNLDNGKKFLDFPYTNKDHMYKIFEEYARKKGWYYTLIEQNKPSSLDNHYRFLDVYNNGDKVDDTFIVSLTPQEYEYYPYLDIMRFYNPDTGQLTNILNKGDDDIIILDNDKGEFRENN